MSERKYKEQEYEGSKGIPVIRESRSHENRTGDWRIFKPEFNKDRCAICRLCWIYCPDSAIRIDNEYPEWNYRNCKGCMICYEVCPTNAIEKIKDEHGKMK